MIDIQSEIQDIKDREMEKANTLSMVQYHTNEILRIKIKKSRSRSLVFSDAWYRFKKLNKIVSFSDCLKEAWDNVKFDHQIMDKESVRHEKCVNELNAHVEKIDKIIAISEERIANA